ncbi:MAG: YbaB/EbfC family nucleoid-associated protein [Gammaproteobacteria bacterium]|nr:MAG: YbaB/EbfC family nucleoid-associated protein [Gammaproteobacteria bacterium]
MRVAPWRWTERGHNLGRSNLKGPFGDMMKQAKDMQERLQEAQASLASLEVIGESGAGMVRVTMTGRHDVRKVDIDPSLLTEDKEVLEDLIAAAVNDAVRRVERANQEKMSELTAGLPLPPGLKLF